VIGSYFTAFGLPLLVYALTVSAMNLAITTVCSFLPYLLFGLVVGAWMDRVDRRRAGNERRTEPGGCGRPVPWGLGVLDAMVPAAWGGTW